MRKLLLILLVNVCLHLPAQKISLADDNRIYSQFIIQLHAGNTIKDVTAQFPTLVIKRCLSQRMNIWLVERDSTTGAEAFLQSLKLNNAVLQAQFNHHVYNRSLVPNDPYFSNQWNMLNTGQRVGSTNGIPGDDIDATDAWAYNHKNVTINGDSIVVAVVDEGFDTTHVDINFFINHHEIPGNGIDDDGNGYIDDYLGWDAYDTTGDIDVEDPGRWHSMHVSGIAGAIGNNDTGVAGTCWGVMIMRVCASDNDESVVVAGYDYVITMRDLYNRTGGEKGAFVVSTNSSFGVDKGNPADYPIWCAMYDSMGAVGILSAAATTDNFWDVDVVGDMPTTCPSKWLISVTDVNNQNIIQTGYGKKNIALAAPGTNIYSTWIDNGYEYLSGTSMACPHVAGAIAAMYAAACPKMIDDYHAYPDSVALIVKQMLLSGVTPASSVYNQVTTGGVLNLYHAVLNTQEYNCNSCANLLIDSVMQPTCSNSCNGSILISSNGGRTFSYNQQNLCYGFYPIAIRDSVGCTQNANITLVQPDSIIIYNIATSWPGGSPNGNITVNALAGFYTLQYSLDGVNYQSSSTLSVTTPGTYTVYIMSESGCIAQQEISITGVSDLTSVNNWNIYPNPANDVLNVSLSLSQNSSIQFSITNVVGETVASEEQTFTAGTHIFSIPTTSLASGIYFLSLQSDGTAAKKFVVAR